MIYILWISLTPISFIIFLYIITRQLQTIYFVLYLSTFIASGTISYYFGFDISLWIPYLVAIILFISYFLKPNHLNTVNHVPNFMIYIIVFFIIIITSTLANIPSIGQALVGFKIYGPIWLSILAIFAVIRMNSERFYNRCEIGCLALGIIQLPFVLTQFFYTSRLGGRFNHDAVVGTFGGDPFGGGQSATLLLMSTISVLVAIEMWQTGRLRFLVFLFVSITFITNISLSEVKAAFLIIPLSIAIQQNIGFRGNITNNFKMTLFILMSLLIVFKLYDEFIWNINHEVGLGAISRAQKSLDYFFNPSAIDFQTGEVSRGASLMIWWNDTMNFAHRLVGYGAGSIRIDSAIAEGVIGRRFAPLSIASTAVAQLLWDSGFLGLTFFVIALGTAYRRATQCARVANNRTDFLRMRTIAAILAIMIPLLVYNRHVLDAPSEQLVMVTIFAILWERSPTVKILSTNRGFSTRADRRLRWGSSFRSEIR